MALSTVVKMCQVPFGGDVYLLVTYAVGGSGLCVVMKIFLRFRCFKSSGPRKTLTPPFSSNENYKRTVINAQLLSLRIRAVYTAPLSSESVILEITDEKKSLEKK